MPFNPAGSEAGQQKDSNPDVTKPFALARRYDTSSVGYYHSSSRYDGLSAAKGELAYRFTVSGDFRRKVIGPREDGCVLEEFKWRNVKITYFSTKDQTILNVKDLPFAEGFTYRLCFEDEYNDISELVDHSRLPNTMDGFLFYEQIIDAHSPFDWLLTRKHGQIHLFSTAGTVVELPRRDGVDAVDFRPFGYWQFYPVGTPQSARFQGLTLVDGEVGAMIELLPPDVPIPFDSTVNAGEQTVRQKMVTDWWGQVAMSTRDGLPLWGEMYERATPVARDQLTATSLASIQRKVSLSRIPSTQFGTEKPQ